MELIVDFPQVHQTTTLSVSFGDVEVKFVEDHSLKHRADLWYSEHELISFKYQTALIIRTITRSGMTMAQYAELHHQETSAFLGLEDYLSAKTSEEIKNRRKKIVEAVLLEQHRQYSLGIKDWDLMSSSSQTVSDLSMKRALIIGIIHAKET